MTLPPDPTVVGGPADPESAYLADVDAIVRGARRYATAAARLGEQVGALDRIAAGLALSGPASPREVVTDPLMSLTLVWVARRLAGHARDRAALAERITAAAYLVREVDEEGRERFRGLIEGTTPMPATSPWLLERRGVCTTAPDRLESTAPARCPQSPPWLLPELYGEQQLSIGEPQTMSSTRGPGVAGLIKAVHDAYGATGPDGPFDAVDVQARTYRDERGQERTSYLVALPGTTNWDPLDLRTGPRIRSMRPNLEGTSGVASAEARLVPEILEAAGVPPGAEVLLVGHSQGGMTAMAAAALPALRRYRVQVLTAGSPVGRLPEVPGVRYTHLVNRGDVVPAVEGVPSRRSRGQVTVGAGRRRDPLTAHAIDTYEEEAARLDAAPPESASYSDHLDALEQAGHLGVGQDDDITTVRVPLSRR